MSPATRSAASSSSASFTPPALPRPPTRTCALITTADAPSARKRPAAARASGTVWATAHGGHGQPLREEQRLGVGFLDLHVTNGLRWHG